MFVCHVLEEEMDSEIGSELAMMNIGENAV
jgi:hypothetical protein